MKRPQEVTETSKAAYAGFYRLGQREAVARFIKEETRHGRPVWISKIAANAEALGHPGLALNAGARLNEIKENGIELDGEYYTLVKLDKKIKTAIIQKVFNTTSKTEIEKMDSNELNFRRQELNELFKELETNNIEDPIEFIQNYSKDSVDLFSKAS